MCSEIERKVEWGVFSESATVTDTKFSIALNIIRKERTPQRIWRTPYSERSQSQPFFTEITSIVSRRVFMVQWSFRSPSTPVEELSESLGLDQVGEGVLPDIQSLRFRGAEVEKPGSDVDVRSACS